MRKITLFLYDNGNHYRAVAEPEGLVGDAWPVRRYIEDGIGVLEAVVVLPGVAGTRTYRFMFEGNNWTATSSPIARVSEIDLV